jgi:hypothetical protein
MLNQHNEYLLVTEQVMSLQAETADMTISLANKSFYFPKTAIV